MDEKPARSIEAIFGFSIAVNCGGVVFEDGRFKLPARYGLEKGRNLGNLVFFLRRPARFESIALVHYDSE